MTTWIKNAEIGKNKEIKNAETCQNKRIKNAERGNTSCLNVKYIVKCKNGKKTPMGKLPF